HCLDVRVGLLRSLLCTIAKRRYLALDLGRFGRFSGDGLEAEQAASRTHETECEHECHDCLQLAEKHGFEHLFCESRDFGGNHAASSRRRRHNGGCGFYRGRKHRTRENCQRTVFGQHGGQHPAGDRESVAGKPLRQKPPCCRQPARQRAFRDTQLPGYVSASLSLSVTPYGCCPVIVLKTVQLRIENRKQLRPTVVLVNQVRYGCHARLPFSSVANRGLCLERRPVGYSVEPVAQQLRSLDKSRFAHEDQKCYL